MIRETFKRFCESTLAEPGNKSKANQDLCNEVYARTQLIDLSPINNPDLSTEGFFISNPEFNFDLEGNLISKLQFPVSEINLPFDSCFVKLIETAEGTEYIFIREFKPMEYTGCFYIVLKNKDWMKSTFSIREGVISISYPKNFLNFDYDDVGATPHSALRCIKLLNSLSPKNHDIYIQPSTRPMYYRMKRRKEVLKVTKPIYIYCNKKYNPAVRGEYQGVKLERTNSWFVRGHWRRLDNLHKRGKNSQGEYVVEGFTWVKPHICGNKDLQPDNREYIVLN